MLDFLLFSSLCRIFSSEMYYYVSWRCLYDIRLRCVLHLAYLYNRIRKGLLFLYESGCVNTTLHESQNSTDFQPPVSLTSLSWYGMWVWVPNSTKPLTQVLSKYFLRNTFFFSIYSLVTIYFHPIIVTSFAYQRKYN